jgi:hypothetical protein
MLIKEIREVVDDTFSQNNIEDDSKLNIFKCAQLIIGKICEKKQKLAPYYRRFMRAYQGEH